MMQKTPQKQVSQTAKGHKMSSSRAKNSKVHLPPLQRPKIPLELEKILKSEIVKIYHLPRYRLVTAETQKVLGKQAEKVRLAERFVAEDLEQQESQEEKQKVQTRLQLKSSAKKEKIQKTIDQVQGVHARNVEIEQKAAEFRALKKREAFEKQQQISLVPGSHHAPKRYLDLRQHFRLLGEDEVEEEEEEDERTGGGGGSSPKKKEPSSQTYEELSGEFEDAEWSEAEEYGYDKQFPYKKKGPLVNKEQSLPPYEPPTDTDTTEADQIDDSQQAKRATEVKKKSTKVVEENSLKSEETDVAEAKPSPKPKGKITSKSPKVKETPEIKKDSLGLSEVVRLRGSNDTRLVKMSEVNKFIDKAAVSIQTLMGKIAPKKRSGPTPLNTASETEYIGESEEINVDVETDEIPYSDPKKPKPPQADKSTQVKGRDIRKAYRKLAAMEQQSETEEDSTQLSIGESRSRTVDEHTDDDGEIFQVRRVSSSQRDASTLVRPIGYKELELSAMPDSLMRFEAATQVNEHSIDEEFAISRGVFLSENDILWPTVEEFDLEKVAPRITGYITKCWQIDPRWMYWIHPVQTLSDDVKKCYVFEVKFSVPTPQNPIPHATASVFFIFEISHYSMMNEVVKVHYVIEGTRFLHSPNNVPFQDKWLWSVISDKIRLQRAIDLDMGHF